MRYQTRLQRYFDKYYKPYEETAEWYVNPADNKWRFQIPELRLIITLTCNEQGTVTETRTKY
jgi:hypothetical protein